MKIVFLFDIEFFFSTWNENDGMDFFKAFPRFKKHTCRAEKEHELRGFSNHNPSLAFHCISQMLFCIFRPTHLLIAELS